MDLGTTLLSGITSFFSIWQICILQISPFFIAYMIGLYLVSQDHEKSPAIGKWFILPSISYAIGFSLFYAILIASGLRVSHILIYHIGSYRIAAGFIILSAALYIALNKRISLLAKMHKPLLLCLFSLFIGISFAIMYSPCITPTLSDILALASQRQTAVQGWYLALFYGLGISIALVATTLGIILLMRNSNFVRHNHTLIIITCSLILIIPALLNISGLMRHYKALVLGFLV